MEEQVPFIINRIVMLKKTLLLLFIISSISLSAQRVERAYDFSLGFRLGTFNSGFAVKGFLYPHHTLEGIAYILNKEYDGVAFATLYNYNFPLNRRDQSFRIGIGAGAHLGFWESYYEEFTVFGPDFQAGIEYTVEQAPLSVSFDWHPYFDMVGKKESHLATLALTLRLAIK